MKVISYILSFCVIYAYSISMYYLTIVAVLCGLDSRYFSFFMITIIPLILITAYFIKVLKSKKQKTIDYIFIFLLVAYVVFITPLVAFPPDKIFIFKNIVDFLSVWYHPWLHILY